MTERTILDLFHRDLRKVLLPQIDERMAAVAAGMCASFDEYRFQVGYLTALHEVLKVCGELEEIRDPTPKKPEEEN